MKRCVKMAFNADMKNVLFARGVVASFFLDEDVNVSIVNEIKTIISEAVTNAIIHGYDGDIRKMVELELYLNEKDLKIIIKDEGIGIEDIELARQPLFSSKVTEERAGLGFTIMDIFSDSLEVISEKGKGTKLIITKII